MPGTRGGDRAKRINYCISCRNAIPPGKHAQMIRFTYLCQTCRDRGLRLSLEEGSVPGRKTVRLRRREPGNPNPGENSMRGANPAPQNPQPVPTGSNCAHIGCP